MKRILIILVCGICVSFAEAMDLDAESRAKAAADLEKLRKIALSIPSGFRCIPRGNRINLNQAIDLARQSHAARDIALLGRFLENDNNKDSVTALYFVILYSVSLVQEHLVGDQARLMSVLIAKGNERDFSKLSFYELMKRYMGFYSAYELVFSLTTEDKEIVKKGLKQISIVGEGETKAARVSRFLVEEMQAAKKVE